MPKIIASAFALAAQVVLVLVATSAEILAQAAPPAVVRDSAGVRIVEAFPEVWPPADVWRIPDAPSSSIGVRDGDPDYTLFRVRGTVGLPDGGTLVAEGDARLRYYDTEGRHVRTLDRRGEGPGEAMGFSSLGRYRGDSIWVVTRISTTRSSLRSPFLLFSGNGDPGRGGTLEAHGERTTASSEVVAWADQALQAVLEDGSWIVLGAGTLVFGGRTVGEQFPLRSPIYRFDPSGQRHHIVGRVSHHVMEYRPNQNNNFGEVFGAAEPPPARARGMSIYYNDGRRFVVDVREATPIEDWSAPDSVSTRLARSFRVHAPIEPYSRTAREAYISAAAQYSSRTEAYLREFFTTRAWVDSVPAVQDLRVDAVGNIWLELYRPPGLSQLNSARNRGMVTDERLRALFPEVEVEKLRSSWVVLAPDGRLLGRVGMPAGLQVFEIGADYVLGLQWDEFGVQYVVRYPILKG